jgi:hypothetical protein
MRFSVQLKITDKENGGNRKVSSTKYSEDEFAGGGTNPTALGPKSECSLVG